MFVWDRKDIKESGQEISILYSEMNIFITSNENWGM